MSAFISARDATAIGQAGGGERMNATRPSAYPLRETRPAVLRPGLLMLTTAAGIAALVGSGLQPGPSRTARGGDDLNAARAPGAHAAFIVEIQRSLKVDDVRLVALARQVLEERGKPGEIEEQFDRVRIDALKAEGEYQYAANKREIAELALKKFVEADFPQELAAADAQIHVAQADLVRAREKARQANGELEKVSAALEVDKATFAISEAETRRDALVRVTRCLGIKERDAQLAKAQVEERSRKAEWDLLKGRLEKLRQAASARPVNADVANRILALFDRAVPIEERLHAGLVQLKKGTSPANNAEGQMRSWIHDLEAVIDEAESIKAADDLARLKSRIAKAARGHRAANSR